MTQEDVAAAVERVSRFLDVRAQASSVDPEILLTFNGRRLLVSDLRLLCETHTTPPGDTE